MLFILFGPEPAVGSGSWYTIVCGIGLGNIVLFIKDI